MPVIFMLNFEMKYLKYLALNFKYHVVFITYNIKEMLDFLKNIVYYSQQNYKKNKKNVFLYKCDIMNIELEEKEK